MDVIGHQHVRMDRAYVLAGEFLEEGEIKSAIVIAGEAGCSIHASLDDVERMSRNSQSGVPRHGMSSTFMHALTRFAGFQRTALGHVFR